MKTKELGKRVRLFGVVLALLVGGVMTIGTATPAAAATIDINVHFSNTSDSALTLVSMTLDAGCWTNVPPTTIAIDQTVDITSRSCGVLTGTEFHVVYKLDRSGRQVWLRYNNPYAGDDVFDERAPQGYAFSKSGTIENRTANFGCNSKTCDGIPDAWKTAGVTINPGSGNPPQFVDLPKMGVSLDRPNVLVQLDWMQGSGRNQRLRQGAIDTVITAFDQSPVRYRGATKSGITLVVDAGPTSTIAPGGATWGSLSRAKPVTWVRGFLTKSGNGYQKANFYTLLKSNFVPTGRLPIFHYAVSVANLVDSTPPDTRSGLTPEDMLGFIVSLGGWIGGVGTQNQQTGAFMHELGHTLGLDHSGGDGNADSYNYKPNYPSIMNYAYTTRGVFRGGTQVFDYSRDDSMAGVNETKLTEAGGVNLGANPSRYGTTNTCTTTDSAGNVTTTTNIQPTLAPVDWNCDGTTPNGGTGFDSNGDNVRVPLSGPKLSDWNTLRFKTGGVGAGDNAKDTVTIPAEGVSAPSTELTAERDGMIRVLPITPTLTYTGAGSGDYHDAATMSAKLLADGDAPVPHKTINFRIGSGDACSAVTDATGTASCDITLTQVPGEYPITATFPGDPIYRAASDAGHTFTITRQETTLSYGGDVKLANGTPANLAGTLKEDGGAPITGASVTLTVGGGTTAQSCAAATDSSGVARCTIPVLAQPLTTDASVPLRAAFDGDQYYLPSNDAATGVLNFMTGRAFGLSADVRLPLVSLRLPPQPDTGSVRTAAADTTATPCAASLGTLLVSTHGVCPNVTTRLAPGKSVATSTLQDLTIGLPGLPVIRATAVRSESTSTCSAATGSVSIANLTIGGTTVDTDIAPNSGIDLGGGARLIFNEQVPVPGADHGLTVNALHLTVLGKTVDVVVGSSTSDMHNC